MEWTYSLRDIAETAARCWKAAEGFTVLALHGDMGAGKTTLVHALCDLKGVKDPVGSPTFSIINEYAYDCEGTRRILFHIDLYRLGDEEEAIRAGVEDCLHSGHTCLVEWPGKAPRLFPAATLHLYLEPVGSETRKLRIEGI